jgi:formylglycine-generating enzyme required for sulfatase activity
VALPDDNPFVSLATHVFLMPDGADGDPLLPSYEGNAIDLAEELEKSPESIRKYVDQSLAGLSAYAKLVLFIDQFEELFTKSAKAYRESFCDLLGIAIEDSRVRILATLRDDYQSEALQFRSLTRLMQGKYGPYPVGPPEHDALKEIICRPAELAGVKIDGKLPNRIIQDAGNDPGVLPLIAFCLAKLWRSLDKQLPPLQITLDMYIEIGGLHTAIGQHANEEIAKHGINTRSENILESIFPSLVTMDSQKAIRRRAAPAELSHAKDLVDRLIYSHLLCAHRINEETSTVELSHDSLLVEWPVLRNWIEANQVDLLLWEDLLRIARKWNQIERGKNAFLWRGWRLKQAKELIKRRPFPKPPDERADVERFIRAATARKWINRAYLGAAGLAFSVLGIVLLFIAVPSLMPRGTMPVDSFSAKANDYGLHNVLGNVWEWTGTCLSAEDQLLTDGLVYCLAQGGSWDNHEDWKVRSDYRLSLENTHKAPTVGFRIAMEVKPGDQPLNLACPRNVACPEMVIIKSGVIPKTRKAPGKGTSCLMERKTEQPVELVDVERFAIGKYEVSIGEWEAYLVDNGLPPDETRALLNRPITDISHEDAQAYTVWLSGRTNRTYRLPNTYEWEHAARGGKSTCRYWGPEIGSGNANCGACGFSMTQLIDWVRSTLLGLG